MTITIDQFEARNATLEELVPKLKWANDCKADAIVGADAIEARYGRYHVTGMGYEARAGLDPTSVGEFIPTVSADGDIASALKIPVAYHRRMRDVAVDLYDANVNGWLHGQTSGAGAHFAGNGYADRDPDGRNFMVRTYVDLEGGPGILRALLSDRYLRIDNYDVLLTVLQAVKEAGVEIHVARANLTERRMSVHIIVPSLTEAAPELLESYRSPVRGWTLEDLQKWHGPDHLGWGGEGNGTPPLVFAGFEITCGETGSAKASLWPRIEFMACKNGLVIEADAIHRVHLGGQLPEGQINWSDETHRKNMDLIASMTRDTVSQFCNVEYVRGLLRGITEKAVVALDDPAATITMLAKEFDWDESTEKTILDHFIRGGQTTAGGIMQAMTSAAQVVDSADVAYDLEHSAMRGLELAAKS